MLIGLTGKSCSGKNYVGKLISDMGLLVWDMDKLCHDGLIENIDAIKSTFGDQVVCYNGKKVEVLRSEIAKVVFADASKRTALEDILYPWLKEKVLRWESNNPDKVLFLNGALLYRSEFDKLCKYVIYVDANHEIRLQRALVRDKISTENFEKRENSQKDVDFRVVKYRSEVHIIENNGANLEEVGQQVFAILKKLDII
ncbi:MAG: dephospho-CoA kinase [Sphaerochaetaceae bacterium]|nr:dephospho-CoA kinase [Sphaerochaetaceae bacterium]